METLIKKFNNIQEIHLKSKGYSMHPLLDKGDVIYFKKKSFSKIKENDLLVFYKNKNLICHRTIYKDRKNRFLISRGDNNLKDDGRIYPKQILGVVTKIKRESKIFDPENLYLVQSTYYFEEILKLKKELEKKKINHLFLKGLPVHLYYEGSHPRRIYADFDLLIERKSQKKAAEILSNLDYQPLETSLFKKNLSQEKNKKVFLRNHSSKWPILIDLHFETSFLMTQLINLSLLYPKDLINKLTKEMLNTKKIISLQGQKFSFPREDYFFVYLCLHLFHHNLSGSFRYRLIERILTKKKASQKKLLKMSQEIISRFKLEGFVYPVSFFLRKYYYPLPASFLSKIKPKCWLKGFYTRKFLLKTNIFSDRGRVDDGVFRFINLLILSPAPLWKKIFVFFNLEVILAVYFVFYTKIKTFLFGLKRFYPHASIAR
ncbi:MAG: nucleotidyltransferase family protein [Patescibacteria group bacterium]|nr:nucleotidyltransferase family protein [Patescibacteria group bacterium]